MRVLKYVFALFICSIYLCGWGVSLSRLNNKLKSSTNANEKTKVCIDLANYYKYNDIDSTLYYCDLGLPLAISNKDKESEIEILILKSDVFQGEGKYDDAMGLAKLAHEIAQKLSDRSYFAKTTLCLGNNYMTLMVLDIAYTHFLNAIDIFRNEGNNFGLARGYNSLGVLQGRQEQIKEALVSFEEALKYVEIAKDTLFHKAVMSNLGLAYMKSGDYKRAETIFTESISDIDRYNIPFSASKNYLNLSNLHILSGDIDKAIQSCNKALEIATSQNDKLTMARTCYYLGHVYYTKDDYDLAIDYFEKAYAISCDVYPDITAEVLRYYADIYYNRGDYKLSSDYAFEYQRYSDSLNKKSNFENLLRLKFEYDYKQQQAAVKSKQNRTVMIYIGVVVVLLFLLLLLWALYMRQRLKIKNIELGSVRLELELEHRNKEIATKMLYLQQKNDLILDIAEKLTKSKYNFKSQNIPLIEEIVRTLTSSTKDSSWEEFEMRFENVHVDFFKRLNGIYPNLTLNEKRLCAYLRLNMTSKDIAVLTNTTASSVDQARFRLRKKFGINSSEVDLVSFIEGI